MNQNCNKKEFVEPSCRIEIFSCTDIVAVSDNWYGGQMDIGIGEIPKIS